MKAHRRASRLLGIGGVVVAMLAGCGDGSDPSSQKGDGTPRRGGDLVVGMRSNPVSFDSAKCGGRLQWQHCQPIYGSLLRYNLKTEKLDPALAESFTSDDGRTWTLKLKPNIKFSDGTVLDAEAVDFNWTRAKDPKTLSSGLYWLSQMEWEVVDDLTLQITLKTTNYQLPWAMQYELGLIGSPTAIMKEGDDFGTKPVGAGPFVLSDFRPNSEVKFTRSETYVEKGLPYADSLTLKVIPADAQRVQALRAGEINIHGTYLNKDAKILEKEDFKVYRMRLWGGTGIGFNYADPDLKDPDLRRALQSAVNAKQITDAGYPGDEVPSSWFPSTSPYHDEAAGTFPPLDLDEAQQLFDDYLAESGKKSLELTLSSYAEFPAMVRAAELLQSQLMKIKGLTVKIAAMNAQTLNTEVAKGNFQLAMRSAGGSQVPTELDRVFHTGGDLNSTGYSNPVVDKALETTKTSNDSAEVEKAWKTIGGELSKDAPVRLYAQEFDIVITANNVHGLNPVNVGSMSSELVWLD